MKQNRHKTLNNFFSCVTASLPLGRKFWIWREPWLFSGPCGLTATPQCILHAARLQPASTREGKQPCPVVISLCQRPLSSGVGWLPHSVSRQFLPHTPQQKEVWSVSAQHFTKRQVPSWQESCLISGILIEAGALSLRIPVLTKLSKHHLSDRSR